MSHKAKIEKLKEKMETEFTELLQANNNEIEFDGILIVVNDPNADLEYAPGEVQVEKLVYNEDSESVEAHGGTYCEGCREGDATPVDISDLTVEETLALLDQAKKEVKDKEKAPA